VLVHITLIFFTEMFKTRLSLSKKYICIVNGRVNTTSPVTELVHWVKSRQNKPTLVRNISSDGYQEARLSYRVLSFFNISNANKLQVTEQTALLVELHTGRKHQIRCQLAKIGHPIVGDGKYGAQQIFKDR
jgi:23S rRNA pseudouridine1911/1915/1917 synthase